MSRNECKSVYQRIVSNARDKSIPTISIAYLIVSSYRCPHTTSSVDRPRRNPLWDGERKSFTWSEIRCNVMTHKVFRRVVRSTFGIGLFRGTSGLPGFCSAISIPVPTSSGRCFSKTSLNMSAVSLKSSAGTYFRRSPGIESHPHALAVVVEETRSNLMAASPRSGRDQRSWVQ